jgi:hypothetical protein
MRGYGSSLAVLLDEYVGPNIFPAAIFAFFLALFGVASGHDGSVAEDANLMGPISMLSSA